MIQLPWREWECLYHEDWHHFVLAANQPDDAGWVTVWHSEGEGITKTRAHISRLIQNATY